MIDDHKSGPSALSDAPNAPSDSPSHAPDPAVSGEADGNLFSHFIQRTDNDFVGKTDKSLIGRDIPIEEYEDEELNEDGEPI